MRLSIIVPTLDERENLEALLPQLLAALPDLDELIVVDDGSRDGTRELVERHASRDRRVQLLARDGEPSLTESLREGLLCSRGDVVGWMDADFAVPIADFCRMLDAVSSGADLAIASRFVSGGRIKGQLRDGMLGRFAAPLHLRASHDPWIGVAASVLLNVVLLPILTGHGIHDYTSGILVGRRAVLESFELGGTHGEYFISLIVEAKRRGLRLAEVGCRARPRLHGVSKTTGDRRRFIAHGARYLLAGLRLARRR